MNKILFIIDQNYNKTDINITQYVIAKKLFQFNVITGKIYKHDSYV
jgi:hypothetical protein